MAQSKAEWQRQVRAEGAAMRVEHRAEYNRRVKAISDAWRVGYSALKSENDRMQAELKEWNQLDQDQIRNYVIENLERGGPF